MRSTRSYAWVIIVVVAAVLTPSPDAFTMGLLAVPLILLYEICIVIATIIEKAHPINAGAGRSRIAEEGPSRRSSTSSPPPTSPRTRRRSCTSAEIEQYEREHAHLYLRRTASMSPAMDFHGDDSHDSGETGAIQHDESWHADDHYWHDQTGITPMRIRTTGSESDHAETGGSFEPSGEADAGDINPERGESATHGRSTRAALPDGSCRRLEPRVRSRSCRPSPESDPRWRRPSSTNRPYRDLRRSRPGSGPGAGKESAASPTASCSGEAAAAGESGSVERLPVLLDEGLQLRGAA
jgi:hypothetical protein